MSLDLGPGPELGFDVDLGVSLAVGVSVGLGVSLDLSFRPEGNITVHTTGPLLADGASAISIYNSV